MEMITVKEFIVNKEKAIEIIEKHRDYYDDEAEEIYKECIKEIKEQKISENEKIIIATKERADYLECSDEELNGLHVVILDDGETALSTDGMSHISANDVIYEKNHLGIIILTEKQLNEYYIDLEELEEAGKEVVEEFLEELEEDNKVAYIIYSIAPSGESAGKSYPEQVIIFNDYGDLNEKALDAIYSVYYQLLGIHYTIRFDKADERLQKLAMSVERSYYTKNEIIEAIKKAYMKEYAEELIKKIHDVRKIT